MASYQQGHARGYSGSRGPPHGAGSDRGGGHRGGGYDGGRGGGRGGGHGGNFSGRGGGPRISPDDTPGPLRVKVNMFAVTKLPTKPFDQYAVEISYANPKSDDKPLSKRRKHDIFDQWQSNYMDVLRTRVAYDGESMMWTNTKLPAPTGQFDVSMSQNPNAQSNRGLFRVALRWTGMVDPRDVNSLLTNSQFIDTANGQTIMMLLQQLVRAAPNVISGARTANSIFPDDRALRFSIAHGLEVFRGFFYSVRPTTKQILVNVNTTASAGLQAGPVYEVALQMMGSRDSRDLELSDRGSDRVRWRKLTNFFKNVKVMVIYPGGRQPTKARPVKDLVAHAGNHRFAMDDNDPGSMTTVKEYYQNVKNIKLRAGNAFGIKFGRSTVVPGEFCHIAPNQLFKQQVPPEAMPKLLQYAEQDPQKKLMEVTRAVSETLRLQDSSVLKAAGMMIDTEPITVPAVRLPQPRLLYAKERRAEIKHGGAWNVMGQQFIACGTIRRWAILDCTSSGNQHRGSIDLFKDQLVKNLNNLGMRVPPPIMNMPGPLGQAGAEGFRRVMRELKGSNKDSDLDLVVAVLPESGAEIKANFKHITLTDRECFCASQCVRVSKLKPNGLDQYVNNLALKINVKVGGVNAKVEDTALAWLSAQKTMLIGADVTHPGPGVEGRPSVASFVWSVDYDFTRYNSTTAFQLPRTEVISNMKAMMTNALDDVLKRYLPAKIPPPTTILVFRDGVSDGEFKCIQNEEVPALKAAIDDKWAEMPAYYSYPKPKVTFVVVGKRHHVRLFPENPLPASAKGGGNLAPGVVVDKELQSPYAPDWYLLSHGGLKGTSAPAHYILVANDAGLHLDLLKQASYALCYSYHRATRSVSIPAPVYYADLACDYSAFQFDEEAQRHFIGDTSSTHSGQSQPFNPVQFLEFFTKTFKRVAPKLTERFYYL